MWHMFGHYWEIDGFEYKINIKWPLYFTAFSNCNASHSWDVAYPMSAFQCFDIMSHNPCKYSITRLTRFSIEFILAWYGMFTGMRHRSMKIYLCLPIIIRPRWPPLYDVSVYGLIHSNVGYSGFDECDNLFAIVSCIRYAKAIPKGADNWAWLVVLLYGAIDDHLFFKYSFSWSTNVMPIED